MDIKANVGGRGRLVRATLAVALLVVAVRSFRNGKRLRGALAGAGALAVGYTMRSGDVDEDTLEHDTTPESVGDRMTTTESTEAAGGERVGAGPGQKSRLGAAMTCAACGDPIVTGERRGPNEDGKIVHERCVDNTAA